MVSEISSDWSQEKAQRAKDMCQVFLQTPKEHRFLFGRNVYSKAVAAQVPVAGFVDDFSDDTESHGLPIIKTSDLPEQAFVIACSGGRPLTVRRLLDAKGVRHLDYFSLLRWSDLDLPEAVFNEGGMEAFTAHETDLEWVFSLMADETSKTTLRKLVSFRMSYDLDHLTGFTQREDAQYFEPFVDYSHGAPVFLDVGGFDGYTSKEFIRHAPNYAAVHVFEPEPENYELCRRQLAGYESVFLHRYGTGAETAHLRFSSSGSGSAISPDGDMAIDIRRIDDVVEDVPTFIKMDIEGAELMALEGARGLITRHQPALAICVYHRPSDLWTIPQKVFSMYDRYSVYLRHYTESIYETVMFFVPERMHAP